MTDFARIAVVLVLAAFAGLCTMHGAQAATKTASISVSAEVVDTCSVSVSGMAHTGVAQCSLATPYQIVTSSAATDANPASGVSSGQADRQNAAGARIMTIVF
jgi:hypothetical protein